MVAIRCKYIVNSIHILLKTCTYPGTSLLVAFFLFLYLGFLKPIFFTKFSEHLLCRNAFDITIFHIVGHIPAVVWAEHYSVEPVFNAAFLQSQKAF